MQFIASAGLHEKKYETPATIGAKQQHMNDNTLTMAMQLRRVSLGMLGSIV